MLPRLRLMWNQKKFRRCQPLSAEVVDECEKLGLEGHHLVQWFRLFRELSEEPWPPNEEALDTVPLENIGHLLRAPTHQRLLADCFAFQQAGNPLTWEAFVRILLRLLSLTELEATQLWFYLAVGPSTSLEVLPMKVETYFQEVGGRFLQSWQAHWPGALPPTVCVFQFCELAEGRPQLLDPFRVFLGALRQVFAPGAEFWWSNPGRLGDLPQKILADWLDPRQVLYEEGLILTPNL